MKDIKTLAANWAEYERKVMTNPRFTATDRYNHRAAFYAGASRAFDLVLETLDEGDDATAQKTLLAIADELGDFVARLQAENPDD